MDDEQVQQLGIVDFDSSVAGLGGCPYAPNAREHCNRRYYSWI